MKRYYAERIWDGTMGVYSRADRGGDRLLARGMSVPTSERIARLLNADDRRAIDLTSQASNVEHSGSKVPDNINKDDT